MIIFKSPRISVTKLRVMLSTSFIGCIAGSSNPSSSAPSSFKRDQIDKSGYVNFVKHENSFLNVTAVMTSFVSKSGECGFVCSKHSKGFSFNFAVNPDENGKHVCEILSTDKYNDSAKFLTNKSGQSHYSIKSPCELGPCSNGATCIALYDKNGYTCKCPHGFSGDHCEKADPTQPPPVTAAALTTQPAPSLVWTLAARFSNSDKKLWVYSSGNWWYDQNTASGVISSTNVNEDMIAPAFWTTNGQEIKISRTDDPNHTPLLVTTSNCLGGKTFRQKITSYGDFKEGKVWSSDKCLGSCDVSYSGDYLTTAGFSQVNCDGPALKRNQIGFWCDYGSGSGAVIAIGGVGDACELGDHGIGVTEEDDARLFASTSCDFGDNGEKTCQTQPYGLNLWIGH